MSRLPNLRNFLFSVFCLWRGVKRTVGGIEFQVDESLRRWEFAKETPTFEAIRPLIRPGDVVLDIGANFGLYSLPTSRWIGENGRLYAFEPLNGNTALLHRNFRLNSILNATIVSAAVSNDRAKTLKFFCDNTNVSLTASLNVPDSANFIEVDNVRLDDWCQGNGIHPSFIKIDVEGAEMEVLRGAEITLRTYMPNILMEVHGFALPHFSSSVGELRSWIQNLGYHETVIEGEDEYFTSIFEFIGT
jgi:FkbM family methyltransferase